MLDYDTLFDRIQELVLQHSPSGVEGEIDEFLRDRLAMLQVEHWQDPAGNIIAKIPGEHNGGAIAITAHKDEIGAIV